VDQSKSLVTVEKSGCSLTQRLIVKTPARLDECLFVDCRGIHHYLHCSSASCSKSSVVSPRR
jgi:hypothetical protein